MLKQGQILTSAVMQLTSDAPCAVVLDTQQPRREFTQSAIGGFQHLRLFVNFDIFMLQFQGTLDDALFQAVVSCPQRLFGALALDDLIFQRPGPAAAGG